MVNQPLAPPQQYDQKTNYNSGKARGKVRIDNVFLPRNLFLRNIPAVVETASAAKVASDTRTVRIKVFRYLAS